MELRVTRRQNFPSLKERSRLHFSSQSNESWVHSREPPRPCSLFWQGKLTLAEPSTASHALLLTRPARLHLELTWWWPGITTYSLWLTARTRCSFFQLASWNLTITATCFDLSHDPLRWAGLTKILLSFHRWVFPATQAAPLLSHAPKDEVSIPFKLATILDEGPTFNEKYLGFVY